jgi:hypothetical protein
MSMTHKACSVDCSIEIAKAAREKKDAHERRLQARRAVQEKRQHKVRLESVKPLGWHINRTRLACHAYIKARDFGKPCICCGEPMDWHGDLMQIHAGHFRTQAAAGHLRFNEDNIHCQTAQHNMYGAGNQAAMRVGMIERIGLERVEALENDNKPHNWTREELAELTEYFKLKLKDLKKGIA